MRSSTCENCGASAVILNHFGECAGCARPEPRAPRSEDSDAYGQWVDEHAKRELKFAASVCGVLAMVALLVVLL